jgi:hypothetical protein
MTIGKETTYLWGCFAGESMDLPSGSQIGLEMKDMVGEIKIIDNDALRFSGRLNGEPIEDVYLKDQINVLPPISSSSLRDKLIGKQERLYWDNDTEEEMNKEMQVGRPLQLSPFFA